MPELVSDYDTDTDTDGDDYDDMPGLVADCDTRPTLGEGHCARGWRECGPLRSRARPLHPPVVLHAADREQTTSRR